MRAVQASAADLEISIPIQITHAQNFDPTPSPDGKKLIFISLISGKEQLFTMDADGKNIVQLTRDDADHEDPAWSPDGKKIEAQINVVDLATKKVTPVITGGINTYGSWSPDMKQIAFRKIIGEENSEVFVANADGSNLRNLTNNPFFDGWPAWSPDGRKIAFASNRRGHGYQIFVMDADGANPHLIANTEGRGTAPRWSPDGKTIYFTNCVEKDYGTDCEILMARSEPQPLKAN